MPPKKPKATVIHPDSTAMSSGIVNPIIFAKQLNNTAAASDSTKTDSVRKNRYMAFFEREVRLLSIPENRYMRFIIFASLLVSFSFAVLSVSQVCKSNKRIFVKHL